MDCRPYPSVCHAIQAAGASLRSDLRVKRQLTKEHMFYMMLRRSRHRTLETENASAIASGIQVTREQNQSP